MYPITITDIVLPHKSRPHYFIYISDENVLTTKMVEELNIFGIEIKADWILKQKSVPPFLNAKLF